MHNHGSCTCSEYTSKCCCVINRRNLTNDQNCIIIYNLQSDHMTGIQNRKEETYKQPTITPISAYLDIWLNNDNNYQHKPNCSHIKVIQAKFEKAHHRQLSQTQGSCVSSKEESLWWCLPSGLLSLTLSCCHGSKSLIDGR